MYGMYPTLPDGWRRWKYRTTTVSSGEIGLVVTPETGEEVVIVGAVIESDTAGKLITILDPDATEAEIPIGDEVVILDFGAHGYVGEDAKALTLKVSVTTAGKVKAWGFIRPVATSSETPATAVADIP